MSFTPFQTSSQQIYEADRISPLGPSQRQGLDKYLRVLALMTSCISVGVCDQWLLWWEPGSEKTNQVLWA